MNGKKGKYTPKAGVPWTTVSDLRKGKTSMDKMALLTAEKLYEFAISDKQ